MSLGSWQLSINHALWRVMVTVVLVQVVIWTPFSSGHNCQVITLKAIDDWNMIYIYYVMLFHHLTASGHLSKGPTHPPSVKYRGMAILRAGGLVSAEETYVYFVQNSIRKLKLCYPSWLVEWQCFWCQGQCQLPSWGQLENISTHSVSFKRLSNPEHWMISQHEFKGLNVSSWYYQQLN